VADALALSTVADLEDAGIMGPAAFTIASFFGNADAGSLQPVPQPDGPVPVPQLDEPEPEPEPQPQPQPQLPLELLEPPSGPMAEFDEAAVLAWLGSVPGLTRAQQAAAAAEMAEDEYDGPLLAAVTIKNLRRLLKGTEAEGAVPLLLAARDAHLAAEPAAAPSCQICFEPYWSARPSL
jgi:hypothetical protein